MALPEQIRAMFAGEARIPDDPQSREALVAKLTASERGTLLPLVWLHEAHETGRNDIRHLAFLIDDHRQRVSISPAAFAEGIGSLQKKHNRPADPLPQNVGFTAGQARDMRIGYCLWRLVAGVEAMPPETAMGGLRALLPLLSHGPFGNRARMVVAARLAALPEAEQLAVDKLLARVEGELETREWEVLLKLPPLALRDWVVIEENTSSDIEPIDRHAARMRFLDTLPGYPEFARSVVAFAGERLSAITGKQTAYRPDGAFPLGDCVVIERAVLWGLARNERWCLDALGPLWTMAVQAPDPKAKTMPSQSLATRFANATVTEPRPEALRALEAAKAACRHTGVAKKLDRARRAARSALASFPERLLALDPALPVAKDMLKPFAIAVEALLTRTEPMSAADWLLRLGPGRKEGWALAKDLIWEVTPDNGDTPFTALPGRAGDWRDINGQSRPSSEGGMIRLWHPAETPAGLARAWLSFLERDAISQPFLQAGREIYLVPEAERDSCRSAFFSGRMVAATPLVGLARVSGWRSGYDTELHLTLGGTRFVFETGVRVFPGAGGEGETGAFFLNGPQTRFAQVPTRVLSEALRKVDLLVAVGERGLK